MADLEQQLLNTNPEILGLQRQRQLADLLTGQAFNQPQGQMISGHYVKPSALQQALPMINAAIGGLTNANLDTKQQELAAALRGKQQEAVNQYANAKTAQEKFAAANNPYAPQWLQQAGAEMLKPQKLGEGETINQLNLGTGQYTPLAQGGEKLPTEYKEYLKAKEGGFQGSFFDYQQALKRAGAPSVSVNTAKDISAQVGDIAKESRVQAAGAVQTADAANRIIQAVDSKNLISGPGANVRLQAAQIADAIGAGGNTTADKIANSRQAIQGLAQLTLQGRKQMRGEGAITESEGKLAERAMSGDLNFTAAEIRQLAEAAKRSAKFTYNQHQNIINTMQNNPEAKGLVPYFQVPADADIFNPRPVGGQSATRTKADQILQGKP